MEIKEGKLTRSRRESYPYSEWAKQIAKLKKDHHASFIPGKDFECAAPSFRSLLHKRLKEEGLKVSVALGDKGSVSVWFLGHLSEEERNAPPKPRSPKETPVVDAKPKGKRKVTRSKSEK